MNSTVFENYPPILTASDLADILRVSKPTAYEIMERPSFPLLRFGRVKRVMKDEFFKWLSEQKAS